jgi:F-type H+-transporting ATPase subunit delta
MSSIVRRHAQAVFELALERGELERWASDLDTIAASLGTPEVVALLDNPRLPFEEKARLIRQALPEVSQLAFNLVNLLVMRHRLAIINDLAQEYHRLLDAYRQVEHVEVTTAIPLDEQEKERLARRLTEITGKHIHLDARVDPAIIGGLVARIGDTLIDGSTRVKLHNLKRELLGVSG